MIEEEGKRCGASWALVYGTNNSLTKKEDHCPIFSPPGSASVPAETSHGFDFKSRIYHGPNEPFIFKTSASSAVLTFSTSIWGVEALHTVLSCLLSLEFICTLTGTPGYRHKPGNICLRTLSPFDPVEVNAYSIHVGNNGPWDIAAGVKSISLEEGPTSIQIGQANLQKKNRSPPRHVQLDAREKRGEFVQMGRVGLESNQLCSIGGARRFGWEKPSPGPHGVGSNRTSLPADIVAIGRGIIRRWAFLALVILFKVPSQSGGRNELRADSPQSRSLGNV
ncbi:hypothetical protein DFH06DRAFT_1418521 [Mycena polygramma]|nr:hypothetical protein DFH06DRAFT_1418521 [Mycena polygramma]